jgi:hypothetical protein
MLRNAPIRTKLIASLLGPLLVLAVVGLVGIRQNQAESHRAARSTAFARLAAGLAPLIHELQAERSLSTSYIDSDRKAWGQRLAEQRRRLDRVAARYRASAERLGADDRLLAEKIEYGLAELGRLGEQRQAIDTAPVRPDDLAVGPSIELHEEEGEEDLENAVEHGHGPIDTPGKALEQYTDTISDLLDINTEIAPGSNDEALLKGVAASVALARAKDFADTQRSLMQRVYAARRFQGAEHARLSALVAAETVYQAQFEANATEAQHAFLEDVVAGDGDDDVILGLGGDDFVCGGLGDDKIVTTTPPSRRDSPVPPIGDMMRQVRQQPYPFMAADLGFHPPHAQRPGTRARPRSRDPWR